MRSAAAHYGVGRTSLWLIAVRRPYQAGQALAPRAVKQVTAARAWAVGSVPIECPQCSATGRAAQRLFNANADPSSWGPDFDKLYGLADLVNEDPNRARSWLDDQVDFAEELVAHHRADIHAVAMALAEKSELTGDEVRRIIDMSDVRTRSCSMQLLTR